MPSTLDPSSPVQANHRLIKAVLNSLFDNKVYHRPGEYNRISTVFVRLGGSWKKVFSGDIEHIGRLKEVCTFAFENGYLTKKESWTQKAKEPK